MVGNSNIRWWSDKAKVTTNAANACCIWCNNKCKTITYIWAIVGGNLEGEWGTKGCYIICCIIGKMDFTVVHSPTETWRYVVFSFYIKHDCPPREYRVTYKWECIILWSEGCKCEVDMFFSTYISMYCKYDYENDNTHNSNLNLRVHNKSTSF